MEQVGPYELLEKLGEGAMGEVWRAHQSSLNRMIALKVLPSHRESDEMAVRRFRQEGQTAARLKHDNIVSVYDAHVDEPPYYIAMEFLEGRSLADRIAEQGRLSPDEAVAIISQVCAGLEHAHEHGVIHRDIKPANVMISETGRATITDFGIARATDQTRMTATGATFGTPDYMSPEQAKGLPVDHRTDLYSVGAMLFEALTGRTPFTGGGPLTVMNRIASDPPPPPRGFYSDISPALEIVVLKALAKDPRDRFQSGTEMARALEIALREPNTAVYAPLAPEAAGGTSPVIPPAVPDAVPTPVPAPARPRTALLGSLIGVVALMIVAVLYFALTGEHEPPPPPPPPAPSVVPSIVDLHVVAARSELGDLDLTLTNDPADNEFSDTKPHGTVLRQDPSPGAPFPADKAVRVVLSRGKGITVPDVTGMSEATASAALDAKLLRVSVTRDHSSGTPAGYVMSSNPSANQVVAQNAQVTMVVSQGPRPLRATPTATSRASAGQREAQPPQPPPPPPPKKSDDTLEQIEKAARAAKALKDLLGK